MNRAMIAPAARPHAPHLALSERKSLAARIAAATLLEAVPLPSASKPAMDRRGFLLKAVYAGAEGIATEEGRLDKQLAELAAHVQGLAVNGQGAAFDAIRQRQLHVAAALRAETCARCHRELGGICDGIDAARDDDLVHHGGFCMAEIKTLATLAGTWATGLVARVDETQPPPVFVLATSTALKTRCHQGILAAFPVSGWARVAKDHPRTTVIGLVFKPGALNWEGLAGLFYVICHEVICHGLQSLDGGKRENAEQKCAWSEGWMDRVAFKLSTAWLTTRKQHLPAWLGHGKGRAEGVASRIHDLRYDNNTMAESDSERRDAARWAADWLFEGLDPRSGADGHPAVDFAIRLNAATLPPTRRERITSLLHAALETENSLRWELALGLCNEFGKFGDLARFESALEALSASV